MLNESERDRERADRLASLRIERQEETASPGRRPWVWVLAALALVLAVVVWRWATTDPAVPVRVAVAREVVLDGTGATVLNASGYVTARRQATVSSKVTGRVVEVLIEEGMEVAAGQLMARLDASNLEVGLRLTEARVRAAETALEETRVRGREAERDLERAGELAAAGVGSAVDLDRAQAERDALAARLERQRDEVAVARREVEVWAQQIADSEIRAPFAGVVVSKNAQPGEMISPAAAGGGFTRTGIGTVVDMESLEIEVDVNESYINRVTPGQPVEATLDAYPDWQIAARVIAIVPTADRQRATVKVRIGFEALDPRILPDRGVKVAFREGEASGTGRQARVVVPEAAVRRLDGRDVVFVVAEGTAERRVVAIGGEHEAGKQVLSGISAGERVIIDGPAELAGGERVEEVSE
jgi:RND family efflux transporter MFP subunit